VTKNIGEEMTLFRRKGSPPLSYSPPKKRNFGGGEKETKTKKE